MGDNSDAQWDNNYAKLLALNEKYGQAVRLTGRQYALAKWLAFQVANLNPNVIVDKAKLDKLATIGYLVRDTKSLPKRTDALWESKYRELEEFHKLHKHCRVTGTTNKQLHHWTVNQKALYRKSPDTFCVERKDKLLKLGFDFNRIRPKRQKIDGNDPNNGIHPKPNLTPIASRPPLVEISNNRTQKRKRTCGGHSQKELEEQNVQPVSNHEEELKDSGHYLADDEEGLEDSDHYLSDDEKEFEDSDHYLADDDEEQKVQPVLNHEEELKDSDHYFADDEEGSEDSDHYLSDDDLGCVEEQEGTPVSNRAARKKAREDFERSLKSPVDISNDEIQQLNQHFFQTNDRKTLMPSKAIAMVEMVLKASFPGFQVDKTLLLKHLDGESLDGLRGLEEQVEVIEKTFSDLVQSMLADSGTEFKTDLSLEECFRHKTMKKVATKEERLAYNNTTLDVYSKMSIMVIEKQFLLQLIRGEVLFYKDERTGRVAVWAILPPEHVIHYCKGAKTRLKVRTRYLRFKVAKNHKYLVDLVRGDTILCKTTMTTNEISVQVLHPTINHPRGNKYFNNLKFEDQDGAEVKKHISRHRIMAHALDQNQGINDLPQRFFCFQGYVNTNLKLTKAELCDDPGGACKTDVDHMAGYWWDNGFTQTLCHHSLNSWLHQMRLAAGDWSHPYYNQDYLADREETRCRPDFSVESLPPTLKPSNKRSVYKRVPWIDMYTRLVAYHEVHGDTKVPSKHHLYQWVYDQRRRCTDPTKIALLKKIGITFGTNKRVTLSLNVASEESPTGTSNEEQEEEQCRKKTKRTHIEIKDGCICHLDPANNDPQPHENDVMSKITTLTQGIMTFNHEISILRNTHNNIEGRILMIEMRIAENPDAEDGLKKLIAKQLEYKADIDSKIKNIEDKIADIQSKIDQCNESKPTNVGTASSDTPALEESHIEK